MDTGQFLAIETVAAQNIARVCEISDARVPEIEQAIRDEVRAMGAHFAFTIEDMRKQWETAVASARQMKFVAAGLLLLGSAAGFAFGIWV